jgi:hypothetical protein
MKKWIYLALAVVIIGGLIAYKVYNKPHKDVAAITADYTLDAEELFNAFQENESKANEMYLDKILQVTGKVRKIEQSEEYTVLILESGDLMGGIRCEFAPGDLSGAEISEGEEVTLKGICSGSLMDVVLVRCTLN